MLAKVQLSEVIPQGYCIKMGAQSELVGTRLGGWEEGI